MVTRMTQENRWFNLSTKSSSQRRENLATWLIASKNPDNLYEYGFCDEMVCGPVGDIRFKCG